MVKPSASKAYIMPSARPFTTCWPRTSSVFMGGFPGQTRAAPARASDPRLLLGGHGDVFDLAVPPLVDGDGLRQDVPVGVEGDRTLDRDHLGGLDGVPEAGSCHGLARLRSALDGVGDHVDSVVGGDGVVGRLTLHLALELGHPGLYLRRCHELW